MGTAYCGQCGNMIDDNSVFCGYCGSRMGQAPEQAPEQVPPVAPDAAAPEAVEQPSAPVENAVPTLSPEQQAVLTDLHWLAHQGFVLEFADGRLETAKKPVVPAPAAPQSKEQSQSETPAVEEQSEPTIEIESFVEAEPLIEAEEVSPEPISPEPESADESPESSEEKS